MGDFHRLRLLGLGLAAALLASSAAAAPRLTDAQSHPLEVGGPLPRLAWGDLPGPDRAYLGVSAPEATTEDVPGEILLVEFFNVHCQSCMAQAPVMAELTALIAADEDLAGNAKILGVAEGNTADEVAAFRARYGLSFPLIPDPEFLAYHAFGNPGGTPYTVLCVRRDGGWIVATTHLGAITTPMLPFYDMKRYRNLDPSLFQGLAEEASAFQVVRKPPVLQMPEDEVVRRILEAPAFRGRDARAEALDLPHTGRAWRIEAPGGPYFARVFSVAPVCDICHALHFVAVFDRYGEVAEVVKLRISRYGNQEISEEDLAFLRARLRGFNAFRPRMFDPAVDAVSGATMSSSLVFDALRNAGAFFQDLIDAGLVSP
ncbi:MAG: hypothetical protein D6708_06200 [Candidatus Dadabacteria bacterium]|nr:MAG: hypothetical protein D6708_06200 [Candidatus Dadabacteria bacterium]